MTMILNQNQVDCGRNLYQIWAILSMSLASCAGGTMFAWTSPSIPILTSKDFPGNITLEQASYLTVIPPLAAIIGSFLFSSIMDIIGRKKTLLIIAVPHFLVWTIVMFSESIYLFYLSRILFGLADGGLYTAMPTYMSEVATPSVRGSWGNSITLLMFFGTFLVNSVGGFCDIKTTAYVFITLPVLYFITFSLMPESPYFLIMKERIDEAKKSLQFLRQKRNVEEELNQLVSDIKRQSTEPGSWNDLFVNSTHRKALIAGVFIRGAEQLSGMVAFSTYAAYFFQQANTGLSFTVSAMIFSFLLTTMNMLSSMILDRLGRKVALVISSTCCSVTLLSVGGYFYIRDYTSVDVSLITWFPMFGMLLNVVFYSVGFGIVPTLVIGELFSTSIKAKGVCALNIVFALCVSVVPKLFQYLSANHGMFSPFLLFGSSCVLSTILSFFMVPETTGKTLEEIQQVMKSKNCNIRD